MGSFPCNQPRVVRGEDNEGGLVGGGTEEARPRTFRECVGSSEGACLDDGEVVSSFKEPRTGCGGSWQGGRKSRSVLLVSAPMRVGRSGIVN